MSQITLFGLFVPEKVFPVSAGDVTAKTGRTTTGGAVSFDQALLEALQAGGIKQAKIDPDTGLLTNSPNVESMPLSFLFPTESTPTIMGESSASEGETRLYVPASAISEDSQGRLLISLKDLSKLLEKVQGSSEQIPSETASEEAVIAGDGVFLNTGSFQSATTEPAAVDQTNITIEKVSSDPSVLKSDTLREMGATVIGGADTSTEETADLRAIHPGSFPINETGGETQGDGSLIPATGQDRLPDPRTPEMPPAERAFNLQPSLVTQRWNRQMDPSDVATTDDSIKKRTQSITSQRSAKEDSPVPISSPVELVVDENGEAFLAFTLPVSQGKDTQVSEEGISAASRAEKEVSSQTITLAGMTSESEANSQATEFTPIRRGEHTRRILPVMEEHSVSESEPNESSQAIKTAACEKPDTEFTETSVRSMKLAAETPSISRKASVSSVLSVPGNVESMSEVDVVSPGPQADLTESDTTVVTAGTVNADSTELPSDSTEQQSGQNPEQKPIEVIIRKEDLPAGLQQQVGQNITLTVVTPPQSSARDFAQLVLGKEPVCMNLTLANLATTEGESGGESAAVSLVESAETSLEPQNIAVQKAELERQLLQPFTTDYERTVEMEYKPERIQRTAPAESGADQTGTETIGTAPRMTTSSPSTTTQATAPTPTSNSQVAEAQKVLDQVVKGVSGSLGEGRSHITIRLSPPDLGNVSVRLVIENGSLTAKLFAEQANTRSLLEQHTNTLRNSLAEQGIKVDNVAVLRESSDRYSPQNERNYQSPERGFRDRDEQTSGHRKDNDPSGQDRRPPRQQQPEWNFNNYFA
ncbi:MAG TPA: flagellar hook-length control protein FliK [bacterium]|nr:flagellar hook-length control protein FliK [bacterium]HQL62046.1 flagellar hook-length control protein FliK [bacterium]